MHLFKLFHLIYWQAGSWPSTERPSCGLCKYTTLHWPPIPNKLWRKLTQTNHNYFNSFLAAILNSTILDSVNRSQSHWLLQTLTQTQTLLMTTLPPKNFFRCGSSILLGGVARFWVLNAQLCILSSSRDSFYLRLRSRMIRVSHTN